MSLTSEINRPSADPFNDYTTALDTERKISLKLLCLIQSFHHATWVHSCRSNQSVGEDSYNSTESLKATSDRLDTYSISSKSSSKSSCPSPWGSVSQLSQQPFTWLTSNSATIKSQRLWIAIIIQRHLLMLCCSATGCEAKHQDILSDVKIALRRPG